jgi:hypothetical protein
VSLADIGSRWNDLVKRPLPSQDTSSAQSFETINTWISDCFTKHDKCSKHTVSPLPKRVLEIRGSHVYLRETLSLSAKYACLSKKSQTSTYR